MAAGWGPQAKSARRQTIAGRNKQHVDLYTGLFRIGKWPILPFCFCCNITQPRQESDATHYCSWLSFKLAGQKITLETFPTANLRFRIATLLRPSAVKSFWFVSEHHLHFSELISLDGFLVGEWVMPSIFSWRPKILSRKSTHESTTSDSNINPQASFSNASENGPVLERNQERRSVRFYEGI